jgi:hypothetical protein
VTRDGGLRYAPARLGETAHGGNVLCPNAPRRDWYEGVTLTTAIVGVIVIALSTVLTQLSSCDASKQTAKAIGQLTSVAVAQQDEVNGIANETQAIDNEAEAAADQANSAAALVGPANVSAKSAVARLTQEQRHFILDERPRLDIGPDGPRAANIPQSSTDNDRRLIWNVPIANYGRTTAINIHIVRYISLGSEPFAPYQSNIDYLGRLTSGKESYTSVIYPRPFTAEDMYKIVTKHQPDVSIVIVLRYEDESGTTYKDAICESMLFNGSRGICVPPKSIISDALVRMTKGEPKA